MWLKSANKMQRVLVSAGTNFGERKLDRRKGNDDKDGNCP